MKKLSSTLAVVSILFFASCSKDETQPIGPATETPKTQLEVLQDRSWDFTEMTSSASTPDTVFYTNVEQMIGTIDFLANNTVIAVLPGEENDTSAYVFNETSMRIDDQLFDIEMLDDNTLELKNEEQEMDNDFGIVVTYTTVFSFKR